MKQTKDYSNITVEEALEWTRTHCSMNNVRTRMKSRAVAWVLLATIVEAVDYIEYLETKLMELQNDKK